MPKKYGTVLPGTLLVADTEANELRIYSNTGTFQWLFGALENRMFSIFKEQETSSQTGVISSFFYLKADSDPWCQTNADSCGFLRIRIRVQVRL